MPKMFDVAEVKDEGTNYRVMYIVKNDMSYIVPGKKYLPLSFMAAKIAKEAVEKGDEVLIPKDLAGSEVTPMNLIINPVSEEERKRAAAIERIGSEIRGHLVTLSALAFYEFMCMNMEFMEDGIIITNKNREEKYLEIVKSGDEEMITKLERYLELKDEIGNANFMYQEYKTARDRIIVAEPEDIEEIENTFRRKVNLV